MLQGDKVAQLVNSVGLVVNRPLVQFPSSALRYVLGQDSLFQFTSVYPVAKWIPSIIKVVLRACVLYAASCSGTSLRGLKWCPRVQACWEGRSCEHFGGYKTIHRKLYLYLSMLAGSLTHLGNTHFCAVWLNIL